MSISKERIAQILYSYGIVTEGITETKGNAVTLYEVRPTLGTKISKLRNLKDEIAVALSVKSVRVIAPMPNGTVGIEVPNEEREIIPVDDILESNEFENINMELPLAIGKTTDCSTFIADLTEMPHLLVAGATGQGKSVGLNVMLLSLLNKKTPDELKLILIDPKQVELSVYKDIESSYLALPIITDADKAEKALESVCSLMEQRYSKLNELGVRNIQDYNRYVDSTDKLPYLVVVIDEYGDLIMQAGRQMEKSICRIAQKARAVGIHMIISTQRPSATIVTGDIKANFPTRIAFRTTTGTDSRVVLDQVGAEKLTGKGDMLFFQGADVTRMQCAYASLNDALSVCSRIKRDYAGYTPKSVFAELPKPSYKLSSPPVPNLKKNALFICTHVTRKKKDYISFWFDEYYWIAYSQMKQLGLIRDFYDEFIVTCNDPDEIARRIDNCFT